MLRGFNKNGELKNVIINDNGSIPVQISEGGSVTSSQEIILDCNIIELSTENKELTIAKKVTQISIANCSDTSDVTMTIEDKAFKIGAGLAIDFPVNKVLERITLSSTETNTKIQLVIKGVE